MDLTIKLNSHTLNIRVVVILETEKGFLFEKSKKGDYYFFPGGRIKEGESSLQAAKREIFEETGFEIENFKLISVVENFFGSEGLHNDGLFQEINFIYTTVKVKIPDTKYGLSEFTKEQILDIDIRPEIIKKIILENHLNEITHYIV